MKSKDNIWKTFHIEFPNNLIPLYDFLQSELNFFLSDEKSRELLNSIDLDGLNSRNKPKMRGDIWSEMNIFFSERIKTWTINNKAWHARMVFENLRRELESKKNNKRIFEILEKHNFEISKDFREELSDLELYPTSFQLKNMIQSGKTPELSKNATFVMDYTVSDKQNFKFEEGGKCRYKVGKNWYDYQIFMPSTIDENFTGVISKPRFIKRKRDNKYIGMCSYECKSVKSFGNKILGIDIGIAKLYTGVIIDENGNHSIEFNNSVRLERQQEKLKRLLNEARCLKQKIKKYQKLRLFNEKYNRLMENKSRVINKITRVKENQSKLIATEIVDLAFQHECKEIHVENLGWIGNDGGKWNYSSVLKKIEEKAKDKEIKVVKISAYNTSKTHPLTGEIGKIEDRIVFFDERKEQFDRDFIGALNIALRNKGKKENNQIKRIKKVRQIKVKKKKSKSITRQFLNEIKRKNQIVFFFPNVISDKTLIVWPINKVESQTMSFVRNYKKSYRFE